jgi:tetraacyldisaccharide 4'-kinase
VIILVKPLELAYRGVAGARRRLVSAGVLQQKKLARPVISVGNVAFGGTGKTPVVIAIATELVARGFRVAVLTRGYGRKGEGGLVVRPDAREFGDEPVLIARAVPEASVIVASNRYDAAVRFLSEHPVDVFLLDDGFQHLQLARDLDVVIDAPKAQRLRENRSAFRAADIVLVRGAVGEFQLSVEPTFLIRAGREEPLETLRGSRVVLFSGLADNEQFFRMGRALGADVIETRGYADHHAYTAKDMAQLHSLAERSGAILITTEKDAVRIGSPEIASIRVVARMTPRQVFFDRILRVVKR